MKWLAGVVVGLSGAVPPRSCKPFEGYRPSTSRMPSMRHNLPYGKGFQHDKQFGELPKEAGITRPTAYGPPSTGVRTLTPIHAEHVDRWRCHSRLMLAVVIDVRDEASKDRDFLLPEALKNGRRHTGVSPKERLC